MQTTQQPRKQPLWMQVEPKCLRFDDDPGDAVQTDDYAGDAT